MMSSALKTPDAHANSTTFVSVAVIGGGVAGLAAAGALCSTSSSPKQKILLLEAREELGGRVRQLLGVAPWPVEMGPEFIHGERSSVVKVLRDAGCSLREYEWPDRWFFDDERVLRRAAAEDGNATLSSDERDRDVALVQKLFASVAEEEAEERKPSTTDISATEWMIQNGLETKRQRDVAEACFANDFGAPLDELGLRELAVENAKWDVGDAYYVPDAPLSELVKVLESKVPRECIRRGWPVSKVEVIERGEEDEALFSAFSGYPRKLVRLTGPCGEVVVSKRVVVAVPLAVLKASLLPQTHHHHRRPPSAIEFTPPLSPTKIAAVERLRVGNAIKVVLSFSRPLWPSDFFDAVCPGCFVPEFWVKAPPAERHFSKDNNNQRLSPFVISGFLCGRFAEAAQAVGEEETVRRALQQLDEMFRRENSSTTTTPATDTLVSSRVVDWSRDPWTLGAYSFPSLGASAGDREALARPEGGEVLFFAGEATHEAVNPCLQAAIETGLRAAREVREGEEREVGEGGRGVARSRL